MIKNNNKKQSIIKSKKKINQKEETHDYNNLKMK